MTTASRTPLWWATPATMATHLSRIHEDDGTLGPPTWQAAPHLQMLALAIADVAAGRTKRLAIFAPPRHGKTELVSRWTPTWWMALRPRDRIMLASHTSDYAREHGAWVRDALIAHERQLGVQVRTGYGSAAERWMTRDGGSMVTAGLTAGGQITGRGANLLIIDDPVADQADADSAATRRRMWRWWTGTARTRLEPGGSVILIMTRWHVDDLAGRLISEQPERWRFIRIPALADGLDINGREPEADPLGRVDGEALWESRWPATSMLDAQVESGAYIFSAQYQGLPVPSEGGGILSRERQAAALMAYREAFPEGIDPEIDLRRIVVAVDPPGGRTECGIVVMGETAKRLNGRRRGVVLEDASVTRRPSPERWATAAIEAYHRWGANEIVAETNYGGTMVKGTIRAIDPTIPVAEVNATRGKRARAEPVGALYPADGRPAYILRADAFPRLIEEWDGWVPDSGMESPNRLDAEVWAATRLGLIVPPARKVRRPGT